MDQLANPEIKHDELLLLLSQYLNEIDLPEMVTVKKNLRPKVKSNVKQNLNEAIIQDTQEDSQSFQEEYIESNSPERNSWAANTMDNQRLVCTLLNNNKTHNLTTGVSCIQEYNSQRQSNVDQNLETTMMSDDLSENMTNDEIDLSVSSNSTTSLTDDEEELGNNNKNTSLTISMMRKIFNSKNNSSSDSWSSKSLSNNSTRTSRKRLMQDKASAQFNENKVTDDEEEIGNNKSSSSESLSTRSLSNSNNRTCNLFANKQRRIINEKKAHSEKKSSMTRALFSPISRNKTKQSNVRNLLNQLNNSLHDKGDDAENIQIAINVSKEQLKQRKRLFSKDAQKFSEAFVSDNEMQTTDMERRSIYSNRSIPAGQAYVNAFTSVNSNKSSAQEEAIYNQKFKLDPNSLQQYLVKLRNSAV